MNSNSTIISTIINYKQFVLNYYNSNRAKNAVKKYLIIDLSKTKKVIDPTYQNTYKTCME